MAEKIGVLLIHGLTGTPETLESLRAHLVGLGAEVSVPYVAGHETQDTDLANATWEEWVKGLSEELIRLSTRVDHLFVAGLSMGSVLALKLAIDHPEKINGVALMATALFLKPFVEKVAMPAVWKTPAKYFYKWRVKEYQDSVADPEALPLYKTMGYGRIPLASVDQLMRLQKEVRRDIARVNAPALVIHARHDGVTPVDNALYLKNHLSSRIIHTMLLSRSKHVITMDYDKEIVAAAVGDFFKIISGNFSREI